MSPKKEIDLRFKEFGHVSFTGVTKVNDFVGHLREGRVMGTRCTDCDQTYFPPRSDCSQCFGSRMDWFEVSGTGRLITHSKLHFGPQGFEKDLPYSIAVLDYGDFKIFGRIAADVPEKDLRPQMEMTTEVLKLPNGQITYVFQKA